VWENALGGVTFEIGLGSDREFVKWVPAGCSIDLDDEVERIVWAARFARVPELLAQGRDDTAAWIVTRALPGRSAVSDRWKANPAVAVREIGRGLRSLHNSLPVDECPFSWSAEQRCRAAHRANARGQLDPTLWHPVHRTLSVDDAYALIDDTPPVDRLVVCHGDACAPNTLIRDDGNWSGHVDLGRLGVADRWADLAIATWSTEWNYGPGWQAELLDAYGIDPDPRRTRYYRLLWDLSP
jgi:kanamycin kinase